MAATKSQESRATAKSKVWKLLQGFNGEPSSSDFTMVEEEIPLDLKQGEILIEAEYISVDPYMRINLEMLGEDKTMFGDQIARVRSSKHPSFPQGCYVLANVGWRTLTVVNPEGQGHFGCLATRLPDFGDLPVSLGLGILGMTGLTGYFGLLERGQPKAGETVLVSGAAGSVGSLVGQLAKIQGCTVIGSAGTKEKCDWLKRLGFDHVFNYKQTTIDDAIKELAPEGIDLYFDNVGGEFTYTVISKHMKRAGRVVLCGTISTYNQQVPMVRDWSLCVIEKQLTVLGTNVQFYEDRYPQAIQTLMSWIQEGKLQYKETVTEGFDNTPSAFCSLFSSANIGKAVVKV